MAGALRQRNAPDGNDRSTDLQIAHPEHEWRIFKNFKTQSLTWATGSLIHMRWWLNNS